MRPRFSMNYESDWVLSNSEHRSKFSLGVFASFMKLSDFNNLIFREFRGPNHFAFSLSVFKYFISHVVGMCSDKQMLRVNAISYVTFVKNLFSFWDFSEMVNPRVSMGGHLDAFFAAIRPKKTISCYKDCSTPQPTSTSFFNIFKESYMRWRGHGLPITSIASLRNIANRLPAILAIHFVVLSFGTIIPRYAYCGGPLYSHKDTLINQEFTQVYHDIASVTKGDVRISSVTISTLSVTSISAPSLTAWVAYTPTISDSTNMNVRQGFWRRIGDSMELRVGLEWNGAGAGTTLTVALPSGVTMDTAKLPINTVLSLGNGQWYDASANRKIIAVRYNSTTTLSFDASAGSSSLNGTDFADQDDLTFQILIPITGWTF